MVQLRIARGHTLLLNGSAQIRLRGGIADCLGAPLVEDTALSVERFRQVPIFAVDLSEFEIRPGSGSSWTETHESTIPTSWSEATQIVQQQAGVAVVVGEVDSGKSSLCTLLANRCEQVGMKVGVVDGDVGQADIGPPATVSSGQVSNSISSLQDLPPERSFFIGDTSPSSTPEKIIRSIVSLRKDLARSSDVVIVNTDGWVSDFLAQQFKRTLLDQLQPDLILGLSKTTEIDPILDIISTTTLKLPISNYARVRSKEERKKTREARYRRFLNGSTNLNIAKENVRLRMFDRTDQTVLQPHGRLRGRLSGLLMKSGDLLSIARIRNATNDLVTVETQSTEPASFLEVGNILLSSKYEEIGYGTLH